MMPELRFEEKYIKAAELGEESPLPDLLGESVLQNELAFELGEKEEIYEGYGRKNTSYPYRQYNSYTRKCQEKLFRTAVLENDHLKAVFLLEKGGRLWELLDKQTGRNLLYTNDVLQLGNLALRNAWFSGGVEWNVGVIGHCPFTVDPLYTEMLYTEDGEPVLRMYEYERIRGVVFQMDFWMTEKEPALKCRMRIVNESGDTIPMYWWSNMAVPEYEKGRVIVPADSAYTNKNGIVYKTEIPLVEGIRVCDYQKIPYSVDYFFDIPEEVPKYVANVDASGYGLFQMSTKRLKSRKLFSWGNRDASCRWQEFLTENAGKYLEVQAGLGKTQYGCIPMAPHTAWEWMEVYGAIQLPVSVRRKSFQKTAEYLTEKIRRKGYDTKLEQELKNTERLSVTEGELVYSGSGYGSMKEHSFGSAHLHFSDKKGTLDGWKRFFETGVLPEPPAENAPDEFLIEDSNFDFLKSHMGQNRENWYAWYHLGLGYYFQGKRKKAEKAFKKSNKLRENLWALHGICCCCFGKAKKDKGILSVTKMVQMIKETDALSEGQKISCFKESFKLLWLFQAYKEICRCYRELEPEFKKVSRLRYYYIAALHKRSRNQKAYELLQEDGGMILEDIREGEDSLGELWSSLYESVFGEKGELPHMYNFKSE